MKKRKLKSWVIIVFSILCLIGILVATSKIIMWKLATEKNEDIKKEIEDKIEIIQEKGQEDKFIIDFKSLKEQNPDTIAYIKVNNTNIDYIVVKGKDNSYYLTHNFSKKYNVAGWIFADYHNKLDDTDKNIVIYGHDIKNGSMFGTLKKVLNKEWYENEDNRNIILVTETKTYYYEVFSTYAIEPELYYINTEFNDNEFSEFIKKIKKRSIYDYGTEVSEDDQVLTLSSCLNDGTRRVVLHAKLVKTLTTNESN